MPSTKIYRPSTLASAITSVSEDLDRVMVDLKSSLRWVMSPIVEAAITHAIERHAIHMETLRAVADGVRLLPDPHDAKEPTHAD